MNIYTKNELEEALQIVSSVISRCEKIQPKFMEGTSHYSLLKNRIKALYISKSLLTDEIGKRICRQDYEHIVIWKIHFPVGQLVPALLDGKSKDH
jgi:hypothetical protein